MYEVSPDFGMFTQAWNIYGVAVPIIQHFFGIQPKAYEKTISISPHMPERWKEASIENVRVGDNSLSLDILQKDDHKEYRITQTKPDWTLIIDVAKTKKILVNDKVVERKSLSGDKLMLQGEKVSIQIY
jgi:hypothetical protein